MIMTKWLHNLICFKIVYYIDISQLPAHLLAVCIRLYTITENYVPGIFTGIIITIHISLYIMLYCSTLHFSLCIMVTVMFSGKNHVQCIIKS